MKKELFEVWFKNYGKEIAQETCPYNHEEYENDMVYEKEIRRKAKKIFSTVYNEFSNCIVDKLDIVQDKIYDSLFELNNDFKSALNLKIKLESSKKEITTLSTELYDLYFDGKIDKDYFNKMKSYYGKILEDLRQKIKSSDLILKNIKSVKKDVESLLILD